MQKYELTVVLDGEATSAKQKSAKEKIEKIVAAQSGKVVKADDWGKKDLAYKIGKSQTGVFTTYSLELDPKSAKGVDAKLSTEDDVVRYLLVRK